MVSGLAGAQPARWAPRRRRGASPSVRRLRSARRWSRGPQASTGRGREGQRRGVQASTHGRHERGVQRRSELSARVPCLECREEERGERKREEREKRKVNDLTRFKLKNFNGNSKNFEHESCSKFKFLQLSFQAKLHLSNNLKVLTLNASLMNPLFFGVISKFHVIT